MVELEYGQSIKRMPVDDAHRNSDYIAREFAGDNDKNRDVLRHVVWEHIKKHHDEPDLRLLSMPSVNWRFERIVNGEDETAKFLGIERVNKVVEASRTMMPGYNRNPLQINFKHGILYGYESENACMLHVEASTFYSLGSRETATKGQRRKWAYRAKQNTAVWLDFNGFLSREIEFCLPRAGCYVKMDTLNVPIAVTVMRGRENKDMTSKMHLLDTDRAGYIGNLLNQSKFREYVHVDTYEHQMVGCAPMLTVMGYLKGDS